MKVASAYPSEARTDGARRLAPMPGVLKLPLAA